MIAGICFVNIYFRHRSYSLETQKDSLALQLCRRSIFFLVIGFTSIVIIHFILHIRSIPCVGNGYILPSGIKTGREQ